MGSQTKIASGPVVQLLTRHQVRQVDAEAAARYRISPLLLMENASRHVARQALKMLATIESTTTYRPGSHRSPSALIVCGGGNNGGDGLAAARHLHNAGIAVTLVLTSPIADYRAEAADNLAICQAMSLKVLEAADDPAATLRMLHPHELVIDAIMGTGLSAAPRHPLDQAIAWINAQPAPVLAVDIPSGLDCDTGKPLGPAVEAQVTVTFVGLKAGFLHADAGQYLGRVVVADIGAPRELVTSLGQPLSLTQEQTKWIEVAAL